MVLLVLILIVSRCSGTNGATYQISFDSKVSFCLYDSIYEDGEKPTSMLVFTEASGYQKLYDKYGNYLGEVEWGTDEFDSSSDASNEETEYSALLLALGAKEKTKKINGISVHYYYDDAELIGAFFRVDSKIYELEFDDMGEDIAMKIINSVHK